MLVSRAVRILKRRSPLELAAMIADRAVRPLGFSLLSFTPYATTAPTRGAHPEEIFDLAAKDNAWGSSESISGDGSEVGRTAGYRAQLVKLLPRFGSMFDAPCGDMNWMPLVLKEVAIDYLGGDISPHVIAVDQANYPELDFRLFDMTKDDFPRVDLWHCRDCLFHLSYADIEKAIGNFLRSAIPFAMLTTHRGIIRNLDNRTGGWRYLDFSRHPFNFPEPELMLRDYRFGELPRYVALWSRAQIQAAMG